MTKCNCPSCQKISGIDTKNDMQNGPGVRYCQSIIANHEQTTAPAPDDNLAVAIDKMSDDMNSLAESFNGIVVASHKTIDIEGLARTLAKHELYRNKESAYGLFKGLIEEHIHRQMLIPCKCEELEKTIEWWKKDSAKYQSKFGDRNQFVKKLQSIITQLQSEIDSYKAAMHQENCKALDFVKLQELLNNERETIRGQSTVILRLDSEIATLTEYLIANKWHEPDNESPVETIIRIVGNFIAQNHEFNEEIEYLKLNLTKARQNYQITRKRLGTLHSEYNRLKLEKK